VITPYRNAVTKCNIHVDGIEKTVGGPIKRRTPFRFWNSSERSKRHGKLAAINPFTATANVQNVFVIAKFSTTHDAVKFFRRPMSLRVGGIGRVTQANI